MDRFSLRSSHGVLWVSGLLLVVFSILAASGLVDPLERSLSAVMAEAPLSSAYVLMVVLLGALLPVLARLVRPRTRAAREVLDPFLWFLAGQLACEVAVVLLGGKGLAALVGLVFSLLRLLQLRQLWPITASIVWLQALLLLQTVVWGANALQIGLNRIWPLFS